MLSSRNTHRYHSASRQKNRLKALVYSKVGIAALGILLLVALEATWGVYGKYKETKENRDIVSRDLTELKERGEKIQADITRLETARGIEEEIRDQFGLVKEHEGVIVVVEPRASQGGGARAESILGSVWRGIRGIFSGD